MDRISDIFTKAGTLPPAIRAWEWCEQNLYLSPRQPTPFPGQFSTAISPWMRGWFDAIQEPGVHTIVIKKGAQIGGTMFAYAAICYWICRDPGPMMIVMPASDDARSASENRLRPLIEDSPIVKAELTSDSDDFKKLAYRMRRCSINLVGSNSANQLASRPIRYLVLDECDKYPATIGDEGAAIDLAEQRCKRFWNRKIIKISTPTNPDGNIARAYDDGDKRQFLVPCPKCDTYQKLEWSQVKFDSSLPPRKAAKTAHYECIKCKARISDLDKRGMVERGKWEPTCEAAVPGVVSFAASGLIPATSNSLFSDLVAKFLSVKDSPAELQAFINSELGEVWEERTMSAGEDEVMCRKANYKRGEKFLHNSYGENSKTSVFLTVDVQKFGFWWLLREWHNGDSAMVDYGYCHTWQEITDLADRHQCERVLIDSGYGERTLEVYEACYHYQFIPVKGASRHIPQVWTLNTINIYEGTRQAKQGSAIGVIQADTNILKAQLFERMMGKGNCAWYLPQGTDVEYWKQIVSEELVNNEWRLKRGNRDNHLWDCEVLQLLAAIITQNATKGLG